MRRGCWIGLTYYHFRCLRALFWRAISILCVHLRFVTFSGAIWQGFWGGLQGASQVHPEDSLIGSMTSSGIPSILGSSHGEHHGEPSESDYVEELALEEPHGNDMPCIQPERSRGRGRRGSASGGRIGRSRPPSSRPAAARAMQSIRSLRDSSLPTTRGRKKQCTVEPGHSHVSDDRVCLPPVGENSRSKAVGEQGGGACELQPQLVEDPNHNLALHEYARLRRFYTTSSHSAEASPNPEEVRPGLEDATPRTRPLTRSRSHSLVGVDRYRQRDENAALVNPAVTVTGELEVFSRVSVKLIAWHGEVNACQIHVHMLLGRLLKL